MQLDLAGGSQDAAIAHLGFARTRLDEMSGLLDEHTSGTPLSPELQKRIRTLLTEWAGETSRGTTVLLDQLSAGSDRRRCAAQATDRLHRFAGPGARARGAAAPRHDVAVTHR